MSRIHGSGILNTETRTVSGISGVQLNTSGSLTVSQGETESLTIEAEDNLLPLLTSDVIGGTLKLDVQRDVNIAATKPIVYTLVVKDLSLINVNGSGDIKVGDFVTDQDLHIAGSGSGGLVFASLKSGDPTIVLSGSGSLSMSSLQTGKATLHVHGSGSLDLTTLQAQSLAASLNGHGSISVKGSISDQKVNLTGSGRYEAHGLSSCTAFVSATGSGSALVQVSDTLDASVTGSGSISYIGSPAVTQRRVGSGKIQQRV